MIDYTILYKKNLPLKGDLEYGWDIFISSFNTSDRVKDVYDRAVAPLKPWIILPDYKCTDEQLKELDEALVHLTPELLDESLSIVNFFEHFDLNSESIAGKNVCIDITGFVKPYMMVLMKYLCVLGINKFDVIFSEPESYVKKEKTQFSKGEVLEIRQVNGFEGLHTHHTENDMLVISAGYDHKLITEVAGDKENTTNIQIYGFPSLRPDMFQQNILNVWKASNAFSVDINNPYQNLYAPANDPFMTANILSEIWAQRKAEFNNLYLCPLATKPQALGFTLFYLTECQNESVSMIYPFSETHSLETSEGVSRIWKYTIELDL